MTLAEVEGDAVFVYAPASRLSRGELLLEVVEETYAAFRNRQRTMVHNATCPCRACQSVDNLDLKFIAHYGSFVLQDVAGSTKPVGSCVNLAHRLLKNGVGEATGWNGYVLFTEECLERMDVEPERAHRGLEAYEHLGEVQTCALDLDAAYRASRRSVGSGYPRRKRTWSSRPRSPCRRQSCGTGSTTRTSATSGCRW